MCIVTGGQPLAANADITGKITVEGEALVVQNAWVYAERSNGDIYSDQTNLSGDFSINVQEDDTYIVWVNFLSSDPVADRFYGGDIRKSTALEVAVGNSNVNDIDIAVQWGYPITGKVTENTVPLDNIDIDVFHSDGELLTTIDDSTTPAGFFEVGSLPPGDYYVLADPDPDAGQTQIDEYYGGSYDISSATLVTVVDQFVSGIDIDLEQGGSITGAIENTEGNPLGSIDLDLFDADRNLHSANATTDASGAYKFEGLPSGNYYVRADPETGTKLVDVLYPDALKWKSATLVSVVAEQTTSSINFTLEIGNRLRGFLYDAITLDPLYEYDMDLYDMEGDLLFPTDVSNASGESKPGRYNFRFLPPGEYLVKADPDEATGYIVEYFDGSISKAGATVITLEAGVDNNGNDIYLDQGRWISGTVRDTGGTPLEGIDLDIYDATGVRMPATTLTAVDGTYALGPVPDGEYYVRADPDVELGQYYVSYYFGNTPDRDLSTLVSVSGGDSTGIDFDLPAGGVITGTITGTGGSPLENMDMDIYDAAGNQLAYDDKSEADGTYLIGPVPAGQYLLKCDTPDGGLYIGEYYDDVIIKGDAFLVTVTNGATTSNIDFELLSGGNISGTIRDAGSNPISGIDLDLYNSAGDFVGVSATSAVDGTFTIGPLPDGDYYLEADSDPASGQYYFDEFYGGVAELESATAITISGGNNSGNDITLETGGLISGMVRGTAGAPLNGIDLDVYDATGAWLSYDGTTEADGTYVIGPLPAGQYKVKSDPEELSGYAEMFYNGTYAKSLATNITVTDQSTTSGIDFDHVQGAFISGTIVDTGGSPLADVDLDVYTASGSLLNTTARTEPDGTYSLGPLVDGNYTIKADPDPLLSQFYIDQFFGNTSNRLDATLVTVAGVNVSDIDFTLEDGGTISGVIRGTGGTLLSGIDLDLYNEAGDKLYWGDRSEADGTYSIGPIPPGNYLLKADPSPASGYVVQYYDAVLAKSGAASITVTAGSDTSGIDFDLFQGGTITGTITDNGGAPLAGIDLDVYDTFGRFVSANATTAGDGSYSIGPLPDGDYFVKADPDPGLGQYGVDAFYGGDIDNASIVTIAGGSANGIDMNLVTGGMISGTIRGTGGIPLDNIDLDIYDSDGNRLAYDAKTESDGTYSIGAVPPGQYLLRADPDEVSGYTKLYYDDSVSRSEATLITVTTSTTTTDIDFDLFQGGWISGTILSDGGSPLNNVDLDVFTASGVLLDATTRSAPDGTYTLGPLKPGLHIVRADPDKTSGYMGEYFWGDADISDANLVLVTATTTKPNINFSLSPAGWIEGQVTNSSGTPLSGVDIQLLDTATLDVLPYSEVSGTDGSYLIGPLPVQSMIVLAEPSPATGLFHEYYNQKVSVTTANTVTLTGGSGTTGVNFSLEPGSFIQGTVVDPADGGGVGGVDIQVVRQSDMLVMDETATTLPDGTFSVGRLPAGTYLVLIRAETGDVYLDTYYGGTTDPAEATPVVLTSGIDNTGIGFDLESGGAISGTVRDDGGVPLSGFTLDVYNTSGVKLSYSATSAADGSYLVGPVPPGQYTLKAHSPDDPEYIGQFYDDVLDSGDASSITITLDDITDDIDFDLWTGGSITGTIYDDGGSPLNGISIEVYNAAESLIDTVTSALDGTYTTGPYPDGHYYLHSDSNPNSGQNYFDQFYDGKTDIGSATPVTVSGADTTGIDFNLLRGGYISGTVLGDGVTPLDGVVVDIFDSEGDPIASSVVTDGSGDYTTGLLPVAQYILKSTPSGASGYAWLFYDDVFDSESATLISVAADTTTHDIDFDHDLGGYITGKILDDGGSPVADMELAIYDAAGDFTGVSATTALDGTYSLGPLADGDFYVKARPNPALGQYYVMSYFGGTIEIDTATPVSVAGNIVSDIDLNLNAGGIIRGTITGNGGAVLDKVGINLFNTSGDELIFESESGVDGSYVLGPVPAGDYLLKASPDDGSGYIVQFYDGVLVVGEATSVTVSANADTTDIDFEFWSGGSISGTILDSGGAAIEGATLTALDSEGNPIDESAITAINGTYELGPLPDGDYYVQVEPGPDAEDYHFVTFLGGGTNLEEATPISVDGSDVSGSNLSLQAGGLITGVIRGENGVLLNGVVVDLFDSEGMLLSDSAVTNPDGTYTLGPLPAGEYLLRADPNNTTGYTKLYYNQAIARSYASLVSLSSGATTTGIDFDLLKGGWLAGTILDGEGLPMDNVIVEIFDPAGAHMDLTSNTAPNGTFTMGPLPPGDYILREDPNGIPGHLVLYFDNVMDMEDATSLTVTAGTINNGANFELPLSGWIEGLVTDELGSFLPDISIQSLDPDTLELLQISTQSKEDGRYRLGPLPEGDYLIRAFPTIPQRRAVEYFNEQVSITSAGTVAVVAGNGTPDIDFTLEPGSFISGQVTDPTNPDGLAGAKIQIIRQSDQFIMDQTAIIGLDGSYSVGLLPEGTYILKVDVDSDAPYSDQFYGNTTDISEATPIVLPSGEDKTGINTSQGALVLYPNVNFDVKETTAVISLIFETEVGRMYHIEHSDSLLSNSWVTESSIAGSGASKLYSIELPLSEFRHFCRIRVTNL